jgi:hypothetical protein
MAAAVCTDPSAVALDKVVDCSSCRHDRHQRAHHASFPSTLRAGVRACKPRPALGRGPSDLSGVGRNAADHCGCVYAAGESHQAALRKRCQTVDKLPGAKMLPEPCVAFTHVVATRLRKQPEHCQSRECGGKHGVWPLRNAGRIGHGGLRSEAHPDFERAIQGERIQAPPRKTGGQITCHPRGRRLWSHPPLGQHRLGLRRIVLHTVDDLPPAPDAALVTHR